MMMNMMMGPLQRINHNRNAVRTPSGNFFRNAFGFDELPEYESTRLALMRMIRVRDDDEDDGNYSDDHPAGASKGWQQVSFDLSRAPPSSRSAGTDVPPQPAPPQPPPPPRSRLPSNVSAALPPPAPPPLAAGCFRFDTVAELRRVALEMLVNLGHMQVRFDKAHILADSRALHSVYPNAMFQAASQFNCLEFIGPSVTPERGIRRYEDDHTQGPACAMACTAAAAFRNYLAPLVWAKDSGGFVLDHLSPRGSVNATEEQLEAIKLGQTKARQLNGLGGLEALLRGRKEFEGKKLWVVKNGYVELTNDAQALMPVLGRLFSADPRFQQQCIDSVRIGCHFDCEVTDLRRDGEMAATAADAGPALCSQVFASACSLGYSRRPASLWEPLGRIVLNAAYEATLYAYVIHCCRLERRRLRRQQVEPVIIGPLFLTKLGGAHSPTPPPGSAML
jgi:hypothetical protein